MIELVPLARLPELDLPARFADADAYHGAPYLRAAGGDDEVVIAHGVARDAALAVPLALRPLPSWLACAGRDAETPYGYAAPLAFGDCSALWAELPAALARAGVVNAFLRLHPLAAPAVPAALLREGQRSTALIPLEGGVAAAFAGGRCATQRSQAARAAKLGFAAAVSAAPDAAALAPFCALYDETMLRLDADPSYRFPAAYYASLVGLGERLALVEVRDPDGRVAAAALFMRGPRWAHYHLSARRADCHNAAGALLFAAAAQWAAAHGCAGLHLGGGTSDDADDSLLAYKRRIGRADAAFRTAGVVAEPQRHAALIERWRAASHRTPTWFQAYRAPPSAPAAAATGGGD